MNKGFKLEQSNVILSKLIQHNFWPCPWKNWTLGNKHTTWDSLSALVLVLSLAVAKSHSFILLQSESDNHTYFSIYTKWDVEWRVDNITFLHPALTVCFSTKTINLNFLV